MGRKGRNKEIERNRLSSKRIERLLNNPPKSLLPEEEPKADIAEEIEETSNIVIMPVPEENEPELSEMAAEVNAEMEKINEEISLGSPPPPKITYHNNDKYDSMRPEEHIREFVDYIRRCIRQYDWDEEQLYICDQQTQDLLHYMEMTDKKKQRDGYNLYSELMKVRRERRRCKNEMEILAPVCQLFRNTKLLDQMTKIQGECGIVKESINHRLYSARTDILEKFEEG